MIKKASKPASAESGEPIGPDGQSDDDSERELDERKATILRSIVAEYIETAQPVGSSHVVELAGLDVSPATVRNEMAALEEEGYLTQPHTSAGRVPTDKGYRFFVNRLPALGELMGRNKETVRQFFARTHGELEQLLADTSLLVSRLTRYAAVVIAPDHETATVRSAQLIQLGTRSVLALLVLSDGAVVKHTLELDEEVSDAQTEAASRWWAAHVTGSRRLRSDGIPRAGDEVVDRIIAAVQLAVQTGGDRDDQDRLYVGGTARMAESFDAIETVRSVLSILEQHILVVRLLQGVLEGNRVSVAIGREHGVEPLADCSVVVAPYRFANDEIGLIGVLGPTRMNYANAMTTVTTVGAGLETRLGEG